MAVEFDGSVYSGGSLTRTGPLNGVSSSKKGTVSGWIKMDEDADPNIILDGTLVTNDFGNFVVGRISRTWTHPSFGTSVRQKLYIYGTNSSGTKILELLSSNTLTSADGWTHFVASWDLENSLAHLYIDRTDDLNDTNKTLTYDTIAYYQSGIVWGVGCHLGTWGGGAQPTPPNQFMNGYVDDLLFWPGVYVDLSDEDVLRKFISSDGLTNYGNPGPITLGPVGYGVDGSNPTGCPPAIFFNGSFSHNRGTGGAFTTNGTLSLVRSPSAYRYHATYPTPGERWFDSDRGSFSYPRSRMVRQRAGHKGLRVGVDEVDEPDRDDLRELDIPSIIFGEEDREEIV